MRMRTITRRSEDEDEEDDELAVRYNGVRGEVDWRVDWRWVGGGSEETHLHTHHHPSPACRHIINQ
jgi:hypothetical protein